MDISQIEQCLMQLKPVEHCKILLDRNDDIAEIHITARSKRSSKQISRDIQSMLISQFGLDIDYKKISIAQIECDYEDDPLLRLKLKAIEYSMDEMKSVTKVVLEKDDQFFNGGSTGPYTSNNILMLLGEATLKAVEAFLEIEDIFVLEGISNSTVAGKEVVLAIVNSVYNRHEQILSGSAVVSSDKRESIVKATLDAVNRVIQKQGR